jgi:hypothetical protein
MNLPTIEVVRDRSHQGDIVSQLAIFNNKRIIAMQKLITKIEERLECLEKKITSNPNL